MDLQKFERIPKLHEFINNEINILKSIDNPNIIKLIDALKTQNNYYIVYEYCNGGTLEEKLKRMGHIPEKEVK